MRRMPNVVGGY